MRVQACCVFAFRLSRLPALTSAARFLQPAAAPSNAGRAVPVRPVRIWRISPGRSIPKIHRAFPFVPPTTNPCPAARAEIPRSCVPARGNQTVLRDRCEPCRRPACKTAWDAQSARALFPAFPSRARGPAPAARPEFATAVSATNSRARTTTPPRPARRASTKAIPSRSEFPPAA